MDSSSLGRYESLSTLTNIVAKQSKVIQDVLASSGQDVNMRDSDPLTYPMDAIKDEKFQQARMELQEAARQINELMMGPAVKVWADPMNGLHLCNVLRIFHLYEVPQNVPLDGSISYADLSKKVGLNEDKLTRIIKYAITRNYFHQPAIDHVAHTTSSRLLALDPKLRDLSGHFVDDIFPIAASLPEAWNKFGNDTENPSEAAVAVAPINPKGLDLFKFFTDQPHRAKRFGGAMQAINEHSFGPAADSIGGFDWKGVGQGKIIDCGGSRGHTMFDVLKVNPDATVIVQDLPTVVDQVKSEPLPSHVVGKLTFEPWNFLEQVQPVHDADVYFFRTIFHDWPDEQCHVILKNLVPVMKKGARLVISDTIVEEPGERSYQHESLVRMADMQMMIGLYSRERSVKQWTTVIMEGTKDLDGRLELESIGGAMSVWRKV